MVEDQKQRDLRELFSFLDGPVNDLEALISAYLGYHGGLNFGHLTLLYERIISTITEQNTGRRADFPRHAVIGDHAELKGEFLAEFAPSLLTHCYNASDVDFPRIGLIPESRNEWAFTSLPAPFNLRIGRDTRPAVDIYIGEKRQLFVSQYGYQYFDKSADIYFPLALSRAFSRDIEKYEEVFVQKPVVIVQDRFDGSNFAHFLFDWIPRIVYISEHFPDLAKDCIFLMGGEPGPFQYMLIEQLGQAYPLRSEQIVFPTKRQVWNLGSSLIFFSDQAREITHPLHMCHPQTVRLVRDLLKTGDFPHDGPDKIYISRRDAQMRRIHNETALVRRLSTAGYVEVCLSDMDVRTQIGLLSHCKAVVGPHGMGLTGLIANHRVTRVVEIFNPQIGSDAYAFICRALGMEYRFCVGSPVENDAKLHYTADVDLVASLATDR
jgi:capsular polysaccharide biosynthesis protein